ncbi:unnamed protein product [Soboliphyme baturini]|uniref:Uncharacterized protein n=1 Tax=Soboliphyme baturini TaxID=241478 RepID=A0A183IWP4_9BILA|nr:unnamed protein product [Soboliphyme baturini]
MTSGQSSPRLMFFDRGMFHINLSKTTNVVTDNSNGWQNGDDNASREGILPSSDSPSSDVGTSDTVQQITSHLVTSLSASKEPVALPDHSQLAVLLNWLKPAIDRGSASVLT